MLGEVPRQRLPGDAVGPQCSDGFRMSVRPCLAVRRRFPLAFPYPANFNRAWRSRVTGRRRRGGGGCLSFCISPFQSTPARSGRRGSGASWPPGDCVSIHARAKRATNIPTHKRVGQIVSIHARAKRATRSRRRSLPGDSCFNPRPREAGDQPGRTAADRAHRFQSTPARSGRLRLSRSVSSFRLFQSTPARSGRRGESL